MCERHIQRALHVAKGIFQSSESAPFSRPPRRWCSGLGDGAGISALNGVFSPPAWPCRRQRKGLFLCGCFSGSTPIRVWRSNVLDTRLGCEADCGARRRTPGWSPRTRRATSRPARVVLSHHKFVRRGWLWWKTCSRAGRLDRLRE